MTKKDKQLLLIDLCGRLPYGVKIHINSCVEEQNQMQLFDVNLEGETIGVGNEKWAFRAIPIIDDEDETKVIKPYLRPMSSMTDEEYREWHYLYLPIPHENEATETQRRIDWLNEHHFDYRGLIPMGLALEASENMYKTK